MFSRRFNYWLGRRLGAGGNRRSVCEESNFGWAYSWVIKGLAMADKKTISVYDSQITEYVECINKQSVDKILMDFISRFERNDFILDLGCGPAVSSAVMREHGLRVDPVDASVEMVKLANEKFDIGARQALFEEVAGRGLYDGIWANFSLLHATREELPNILRLLYESLKSNGIFHMGMNIGQGSGRDKFDRFYSYYSEDELRVFLKNAGFTNVSVELGEGMGLAGNVEPWIALRSIS